MKGIIFTFIVLMVLGCDSTSNKTKKDMKTQKELKELSFDQLYKKTDATELDINLFHAISKEWNLVTAGNENDYNSMIAGWGAYGIQFDKPIGILFLAANRYTLERIRQYGTYTVSYLDTTYQEQKLILGTKSGRDTDKMKGLNLSPVSTPNGNIAYKEAHTIVEFKVESIYESYPSDLKTKEYQDFMEEVKSKGNGTNYHQVVTALITDVWIRK